LVAVVGGCWRLLAVVGGCWRLLAVVGGCWRLLAAVVIVIVAEIFIVIHQGGNKLAFAG
jgi:hypothetical protein